MKKLLNMNGKSPFRRRESASKAGRSKFYSAEDEVDSSRISPGRALNSLVFSSLTEVRFPDKSLP
jgi:hypothetical protein